MTVLPTIRRKRSKKSNNPAGSSKTSGHTKAAYPRDAAGTHGRGPVARARGALAQASTDPPPCVGATQWEWVPGIGCIPATDPTKEALDQEGHTIDLEVCPHILPNGIIQFGESHIVPFQGNLPTIWEPQCTHNDAGGYTLHLSIDYSHNVQWLKEQCARNLYAEKARIYGLSIGFGMHPFHFDFYDHLVHRRFSIARRGNI